MSVTHNLKPVLDLPVAQWLRFLPVARAAGSCSCNDKRGTGRYVYWLFSITSFWRYDIYTDSWQQLASPPAGTFGIGCSMVYDPSMNRVWLFTPVSASPWATFAYYDVATNAWTARAIPTGLAAAWGTDACLVHTCSTYNVAGTDDYIYLIGNNVTTWYRFSIAGNAWTPMATVLPATAMAGCYIGWCWTYNTDKLLFIRGGGNATMWLYTISVPAFAAYTYQPATETFTTGTSYAYDTGNRVYINKDNTQRVFYLQLDTAIMYPGGTVPYGHGAAHVGDGMVYVKYGTPNYVEWIYIGRETGTEYWRLLVGFWG